MHVILVYRILLLPKKAILTTFSGYTPHFRGKKQKTRTNNLRHRIAASDAVFLSLRLSAQNLHKWCNNCINMVVAEYTQYLVGPHRQVEAEVRTKRRSYPTG